MDGLTLGEIGGAVALIAGIISGVGVIIKLVGPMASKAFQKALQEALKPVIAKQTSLESGVHDIHAQLKENSLATARVDLFQAISHTPKEHKAILELASHYFLDLHGNSYMYGEFERWAETEKVDISFITSQIDQE